MASSKAASLSPYIAELKATLVDHIHSKGRITDTEKIQFEKQWMADKLNQLCNYTTKPTNEYPEGLNVGNFVIFEPLIVDSDADEETRNGKLPNMEKFYLMFAVMCHLNEKTTDLDKICMPRQCRLNAIYEELEKPGTTTAPVGYAGDRTAGWKHEVKKDWSLIRNADGMTELRKNGKSSFGRAIALEQAYKVIAENHIEKTTQGVKHLGRDATWDKIRAATQSNAIQTQIVKDFVAACPECNKSEKRASRLQGAKTTKANGGNSGSKPNKRTLHESNSDQDCSYSPQKKRSTKTPTKTNGSSTRFQDDSSPIMDLNLGNLFPPQRSPRMDIAHVGTQFNVQTDSSSLAQHFGTVNPYITFERQAQAENDLIEAFAGFNGGLSYPVDPSLGSNVAAITTQSSDGNVCTNFETLRIESLQGFVIEQMQHNAHVDWAQCCYLEYGNYSAEELDSAIENYLKHSPGKAVVQTNRPVFSQTEILYPAPFKNPCEAIKQAQIDQTRGDEGCISMHESLEQPLSKSAEFSQQLDISHQSNDQSFANDLIFGNATLPKLPQEELSESGYYSRGDSFAKIGLLDFGGMGINLDVEAELVSQSHLTKPQPQTIVTSPITNSSEVETTEQHLPHLDTWMSFSGNFTLTDFDDIFSFGAFDDVPELQDDIQKQLYSTSADFSLSELEAIQQQPRLGG